MKPFFAILFASSFLACGEKETQSFEDFQADYFNARQGEELNDACSDWYEDCVAAGYDEEACGARLEYCEDGEWGGDDDRDEEREEDAQEEGSPCDDVATRTYEECIANGGTEDDCRGEAAQAYEDCAEREREE